MSLFAAKTLLAVLFLAAGLTAALSMLTLMGKAERRMGVVALRNMHRVAGFVFATLLVVLAIMGLRHLSSAGDSLSVRGVLHWSIASLLVFVLALKLVVVRWFKQFIKFVPVMGMIVITLALVVAMLSAVFFAVTGGFGAPEPRDAGRVEAQRSAAETQVTAADEASMETDRGEEPDADTDQNEEPSADAAEGGRIFDKFCSGCHHDDSTDRKIGPGLAGLRSRDTIAASGKPMSPENIREQITAPAGGMPSFKAYLSEQQLDDLTAYLRTL